MDIQGVVIVSLATYLLGNFVGFIVHRLLHSKISGKAYRDHCHHHYKIYPVDDYLSDEYREPPLGSEQGKYYIGAFLFICLPFLYWHWGYFVLAVVEALFILKLNAVVHDMLHVRGHRFENRKWYMWLRQVHFQHHVDVLTNMGIFSFFADRIWGSYRGRPDEKEWGNFNDPRPSRPDEDKELDPMNL